MATTTSKQGKVGTVGKAACAKLAKLGTVPANVHTLALLVAQLPQQGQPYSSGAALFAAACPNGYPRKLGTAGRGVCRKAQGMPTHVAANGKAATGACGRGNRYASITPAQWLAAYNAANANKQVHAA